MYALNIMIYILENLRHCNLIDWAKEDPRKCLKIHYYKGYFLIISPNICQQIYYYFASK